MAMNEMPAFQVKQEPHDWTQQLSPGYGQEHCAGMMNGGMFPNGHDVDNVMGMNNGMDVNCSMGVNNSMGMVNGPIPPVGNAESKPKKKPARKRKADTEKVEKPATATVKQEKVTDKMPVKSRKLKRLRFNGMSEEEVLERILPDHLAPNLDIVIIGINPGLTAAFVGHHYAGPGNHMWKCLFLSGLIPTQMNAYDDYKLLEIGIGFTNIVERTSRGSADLSKKEIQEGGQILAEKIKKYKPKIAVFNGKGIYEVFCGHKKFHIGKQPDMFPGCPDTHVFVMPSSSARFTQLPRAIDKAPFYDALRKFKLYLNGQGPPVPEAELVFDNLNLKVVPKAERAAMKQQVGLGLLDPEKGIPPSLPPIKQEPVEDAEPKKKRGRPKKQKTASAAGIPNSDVLTGAPVKVKAEPGLEMTGGGCMGGPGGAYPPPGGQYFPQFPNQNQQVPGGNLNFDHLFNGSSSFVKQEDTSDWGQFGMQTFPPTSHCNWLQGQGHPMPNNNLTSLQSAPSGNHSQGSQHNMWMLPGSQGQGSFSQQQPPMLGHINSKYTSHGPVDFSRQQQSEQSQHPGQQMMHSPPLDLSSQSQGSAAQYGSRNGTQEQSNFTQSPPGMQ